MHTTIKELTAPALGLACFMHTTSAAASTVAPLPENPDRLIVPPNYSERYDPVAETRTVFHQINIAQAATDDDPGLILGLSLGIAGLIVSLTSDRRRRRTF